MRAKADVQAARRKGLILPAASPHTIDDNWQKSFTREPPKSKAELREMLTEAVRNTQPEPKRHPNAERDRG